MALFLTIVFGLSVTSFLSRFFLHPVRDNLTALPNDQFLDEFLIVVSPEPQFKAKLFPKASTKGWLVTEVFPDDPAPLTAIGVKYDGTEGIYFSLTPNS